MVLWHLWIGRARHPGPGSAPFLVEVVNVGSWLTHCDFALDVDVDFLVVSGLGCDVRGWPPFGRLLRRRRLMWVRALRQSRRDDTTTSARLPKLGATLAAQVSVGQITPSSNTEKDTAKA